MACGSTEPLYKVCVSCDGVQHFKFYVVYDSKFSCDLCQVSSVKMLLRFYVTVNVAYFSFLFHNLDLFFFFFQTNFQYRSVSKQWYGSHIHWLLLFAAIQLLLLLLSLSLSFTANIGGQADKTQRVHVSSRKWCHTCTKCGVIHLWICCVLREHSEKYSHRRGRWVSGRTKWSRSCYK